MTYKTPAYFQALRILRAKCVVRAGDEAYDGETVERFRALTEKLVQAGSVDPELAQLMREVATIAACAVEMSSPGVASGWTSTLMP